MGVFFVAHHRFGLEQLAGCLLDVGNDAAHPCRWGIVLCSPFQPLGQLPANRQQQRRIILQMRGPELIKALEMLKHGAELRLLVLQRQALCKQRLKAQHQPAECRATGTRFLRIDHRPMVFAEITQHPEPGQQARIGFTPVQRPGQPDGDLQILGLTAQQDLAGFQDPLPIGLATPMN